MEIVKKPKDIHNYICSSQQLTRTPSCKKLFVLIEDQISYQRFGFQYINFQNFFLFKLKRSSSHANKIEIRYGHERISNVRKNYSM